MLGSIRQHSFIHSVSQSVSEWVYLVDCSIDTVLTFWIITITLPVKIFGCCLLHISTIFRMSILCLHICYEWIWLIFITHTHVFWDEIWFTLFGEWKFLVSLCSFPVIVVLIVVVVVVVIIVVCHCNHYCCDTFYTVFAVCVCVDIGYVCFIIDKKRKDKMFFSLWNRILYLVSLPEWMSIFKCNFKTNSKHTHTRIHSFCLNDFVIIMRKINK